MRDLSEGGILSTILKTSIPLMIAFMLQSAFNVVDTFFVGRISSEAIAAVSISFPIIFLVISLGTGIGMGTTSVIARYIGAKKYKKADNAAEHAILIGVVLSVIVGFAGILSAPALFDLIGVTPSLKALALEYVNILLFSSGLILLTMVADGILRAEGDMVTPMKVMGISAVLNMFLDPIFIFNLGMGVKGAAWATVLSRGVGLLFMTFHILTGRSWIRLDLSDFKYDPGYIQKILKVGIPSSLSNMTMSVGMFLETIIAGSFGTAALAAFGIGFRLDALAILPAMGISVAVVSTVGQSHGAGRGIRAKRIAFHSGVLASLFMTGIGVFFVMFAEPLVSIFDSSPEVVEYGASFLRIIPVSYLVVGLAMCLSMYFVGIGKAHISLAFTVLRVIILWVPLSYFLSFSSGVTGIWWGLTIGSWIGFLVSLVYFSWYTGKRTSK